MKRFSKFNGVLCAVLFGCSMAAHAAEEGGYDLTGVNFDGPYDEAIVNGGIHILAQQCDDGGWGWPHNDCNAPVSPYNTISPIVDGVLAAYDKTDLSVFMNSAVNAADFNITSTYGGSGAGAGSPRLASQTALNLWNMTQRTGDSVYADWVQAGWYDALNAGTYGGDADWDTADYIAAVRPSGVWTNTRPWEFASQALAAERYCEHGIADQFEQAILDGLASLDNTFVDGDFKYTDIIGVVGGIQGLANVNRLTFPEIFAPNHMGVNGVTTLEGLADYLVSLQNSNGSFYRHSNPDTPYAGFESTQTTAYAVLALIKAQERLPNKDYHSAIESAKVWLAALQEADGGFPSHSNTTSYTTEVEAEAIHALAAEGVYDRIFQGQMECYVN